jgi:hypothetical protein
VDTVGLGCAAVTTPPQSGEPTQPTDHADGSPPSYRLIRIGMGSAMWAAVIAGSAALITAGVLSHVYQWITSVAEAWRTGWPYLW